MINTALIIFTRNPELGKCKTRLAATLGDQSALDIYKFLLQHTANIAKTIKANRYVYYSETVNTDDIWDNDQFTKKLQTEGDLGERMYNAFYQLFESGYKKVVIIGSDLLDLNESIINQAIEKLDRHDVVIGPAEDGGYYLLGMKTLHPKLFRNKAWGTQTVQEDTLKDLENTHVFILKELNDIDTFEDMKHYEEFKPFYTTND